MPKEAEMMNYVFSLDIKTLIISLISIIAIVVALYALIRKFQEIVGIETKTMRERRQIQEGLSSLKQDIDEIKSDRARDKEQMESYDRRITSVQDTLMEAIDKLSKMIVNKDLEDMRWSIIDFGNSIRGGRTYDQEAYTHIIEVHDEYDKMLKEHGMENGRVTAAMRIINERYEEGMRNGFPV